jgi:TonB family protein
MQARNQLKAVSQRTEAEGCLRVLAATVERPMPSRSLRLLRSPVDRSESNPRVCDHSGRETKSGTDAEFRFLKPAAPTRLAVRLARELAEAARAIRQDPAAFIGAIRESGTITHEQRRRMRSGIRVAIAFYALALGGTYASYSVFHRAKPSAGGEQHREVTYLASPTVPLTKTLPPRKEAGGRTSKDQLTSPTQPVEQPKTPLKEARPAPRPPDQTLTRTESTAQSATYSPAGETASRASAPDGAARGLTGSGAGTASDGGRGSGSSAEVNYNDVFSISKVTTRPQILARPVPGYTDEARRAQVEGIVKLSVVLNANGTVSDIKVASELGHGLDEKAIEAARQLRFIPAQKDGHTVSVRVFLEFKFTLL